MGLLSFTNETRPPQKALSRRKPVWILLGSGLFILLIGVLWTLRKTREEEQAQIGPTTKPQSIKPPPSVAVTPPPAIEPESSALLEAEPEPAAALPPKPDDLKKVKGIGPKISKVLNEEGIYTFEQLAETDVEYLQQLMVEREWRIASPDTWPEQARHLAEEKRKKQQGQS